MLFDRYINQLFSTALPQASSATSLTQYPATAEPPHPDTHLSAEHYAFLSQYLNPVYLHLRTIKTLMSRFLAESSLELHNFLSSALIQELAPGLLEADAADGLDGASRDGCLPPHGSGISSSWTVRGPPHKWRYCKLRDQVLESNDETISPADKILRQLQDDLFPSTAFRAWLSALTRLIVMSYSVEARRFRPGLDYTLATSNNDDTRLDVVLGLTPQLVTEKSKRGKGKAKQVEEEPCGWKTGEWGGWEVRMLHWLTFFFFLTRLKVLHGTSR